MRVAAVPPAFEHKLCSAAHSSLGGYLVMLYKARDGLHLQGLLHHCPAVPALPRTYLPCRNWNLLSSFLVLPVALGSLLTVGRNVRLLN